MIGMKACRLANDLAFHRKQNILARATSHAFPNTKSDILKFQHNPVLCLTVQHTFDPKPHQVILDMTFGAGGHTVQLLKAEPTLTIIAADRDPLAYDLAQELNKTHKNVIPLKAKFSELHKILPSMGFGANSLDGVLIDAGVSSMQFDDAVRGFSINKDGPLDMRMDPNSTLTAADIVNNLDDGKLYKIFKRYGEEKMARYIAQAIIDHRNAFGPITTTHQLSEIVLSVFESNHRRDKLQRPAHVATKTFQALRIFVNNELNELYNGLETAYWLLKTGGKCIAITFHSLEDRIAKRLFHGIDMDEKLNLSVAQKCRKQLSTLLSDQDIKLLMKSKWQPVERNAIVPSEEELALNPRCRSAKLRAAIKCQQSTVLQ